MKSLSSARERAPKVFGILVAASLLSELLSCFAAFAQAEAPPSAPTSPAASTPQATAPRPSAQSLKAWREIMSRTPRPKKGCFKSSYPSTEWQEIPCTTAPRRPYPAARGPRPAIVGNGNDFSAQVVGRISSATGSFDSVTGVTIGGDPTFSLQLNTQFFNTSICDGAKDPSKCQGWQQFIYSSGSNVAFMQYWLIDFGNSCPSGWDSFESDCFKNSDAVIVPHVTIADIFDLSLTGSTAGGTDTVAMLFGTGLFTATGQDSVLNLEQSWQAAEFNIFGDCCLAQFNFNQGSRITIRIDVNDGTTNRPICARHGFTGETNNLTLVSPCCAFGGTSPAIMFTESNGPSAMFVCQVAANIAAVKYVLDQFEHRRRVGALAPIIEYVIRALP